MVKQKKLTLVQAATQCEMSYRQILRLYQRYEAEGDAGLTHKGRGRQSNKINPHQEAIIALYTSKYEGFGPTLASEYLEKDGYEIDHETLRRLLLSKGFWKRQRKRSPYRQRREPKAQFGELVQIDGSIHVDDLIKNRGALVYVATNGYALGGHVAKVDELIVNTPDTQDVVAFSYSRGGYVSQVDSLLNKGVNINEALKGYAMGGHFIQADELISKGADINFALWGYARAGHLSHVNDLMAKGAEVAYAIEGYAADNYLTPKTLPQLWAAADNQKLKDALLQLTLHDSMLALWENLGYSKTLGCCHCIASSREREY